RPRDARLVHAVLAALGVTAYADRVPLQLMDFAYRYTASILSDGVQLTSDGYTGVALQALRLAIASRLQYQFTAPLAKEFLLELAAERNRVALPRVERGWGVRLPGEKYCFTGTGWGV
ncbi:transcription factor TAFII-31, partial [Patellaria atrata CBS 101060]